MPYFRYKAADLAGGVSWGKICAANEVDVELRLKRMGLVLIRLRPRDRLAWSWHRRVARRNLLSHAPNGLGAINAADRPNRPAAGRDEQEYADGDAVFVSRPPAAADRPGGEFDDLVH